MKQSELFATPDDIVKEEGAIDNTWEDIKIAARSSLMPGSSW